MLVPWVTIVGNDYIDGGGGDDKIQGEGGDDFLLGGDGDDTIWGGRAVFSSSLNDGNDFLDGGTGNDELAGGGGSDTLVGGIGNDRIIGDDNTDKVSATDHGYDFLDGGEGNDQLIGSGSDDTLLGGDGNDQLYGDGGGVSGEFQGNDYLDGGAGDDTLIGSGGSDTLIGGTGNDQLAGDADDTAAGFHGSDYLDGGEGNDLLKGYGGADTLIGGEGIDELQGGDGNDDLDGGTGDDKLFGGNDDDVLSGGAGVDMLLGQAGNDVVYGESGDDYLDGGDGQDILSGGIGNELMFGGSGDDVLVGDEGNDELQGEDGADILMGGAGADLLFGQAGDDVLYGESDNDQLQGGDGIDGLWGGTGDDLLLGDAGNDDLYGEEGDDGIEGGDGNDTLGGGDGDDQLFGQAGDDVLHGGPGNDLLVGGGGNDILNGDSGNDQLQGRDGGDELNGGTDDDELYGQAGNDILRGDAGDDLLDGGKGDDILVGGDGDDTYIFNIGDGVDTIIDSGSNTLSFGRGIDVSSISLGYGSLLLNVGSNGDAIHIENFNPADVFASAGIDRFKFSDGTTLNYEQLIARGFDLSGTEGDDVIRGTNVSDRILGKGGNDTLMGQAGDDTLDGGMGADIMAGGMGEDVYWVSDGSDIVIEHVDEGTDTVRSALSYTLSANVENLQLDGIGALDGAVTGNDADNLLAGADGNDILLGGRGNDVLDGGTGGDVMEGGTGDDYYFVDDASDVTIEYSNGGADTVSSTIDHTLVYGMENLNLIGTDAVNGMGNASDNIITGNNADNILRGDTGNDTLHGEAGSDVLEGGAGADSMAGGQGDDVYIVENAADTVSESVDQGMDTVRSTLDYALGANVENLVLENPESPEESYAVFGTGNDLNNAITGNDTANALQGEGGNDTLIGGLGDDMLLGGGGADVMMGGDGLDIYYVDDEGDRVIEGNLSNGDEEDLVFSTVSYVLTANVERLTLLNYANLSGAGNELNNVIYGNEAENLLSGLAGSDVLEGAGGNDTLHGGTGSDSLGGGEGNDTLLGGDGDDLLYGGSGFDFMEGGAGDDIYYVDSAGDVTDETLGSGNDTVISSVSHTLGYGIENLQLMGFYTAIEGTGNDLNNRMTGDYSNNVLRGLAGDDWIDGGNGIDTMIGGAGNDTYRVDNTRDVIIENGNEGIDSVESVDTFTLSDNVENLRLLGSIADSGHVEARDGTGNDLDNSIIGNDAEGILQGLAGNDIIDGRAGNDVIYGGSGDDYLYGGDDAVYRENCDTPSGEENLIPLSLEVPEALPAGGNYHEVLASNNDTLTGGEGNDTIDGGSGDDVLYGGEGDDVLYGGDDGLTASSNCSGDDGGEVPLFALDAEIPVARGGMEGFEFLSNNDYLEGGAGNDRLDGGSGDDVLFGGEGSDLLLGGGDGNLNASNDDYLDGGTGIDVMAGGVGNDVYIVDGTYELLPPVTPDECDIGAGEDEPSPTMITTADIVIENANEGYDTIYSSVSLVLPENVEALQFVGAANVDVIGNSGYNLILGNAGNNRIDGGQGADYMAGGTGDDTYYVDSIDDSVTEYRGEGIDTVRAYFNDYQLGSNLENLDLAGAVALGYGNELNNRIRGNASDNVIFGEGGDDVITGAGGNDQLMGGNGNDVYIFGRGYGHDVVLDAGGGLDRVTLVSDLTSDDITLHRDGDSVVIGIKGTDDTMVLADWFSAPDSIESIEFCHGGGIDKKTIETSVNNRAPNAVDDAVNVREDVTPVVSGNVLANDTDPEPGAMLSVTNPGTYAGVFGTLELGSDGSYTYTLDDAALTIQSLMDGQVITERFGYLVQDNDPFRPLNDSAVLMVAIAGTNDAPVVQVDVAHAGEDGVLMASGNVLINDHDIDQGTVLTVANPGVYIDTYGALAMLSTGDYTYTLDNISPVVQSLRAGETVAASFDYAAGDGITSTTGRVEIRINGQNDAPHAMSDVTAVQEDVMPEVNGNVLENDRDVDHDTLLSVLNPGTYAGIYGTLVLGENGAYGYALDNASAAVQSLAAGQVVSERFTYVVRDDDPSQPLQDSATLAVAISGTNDAPILLAPLADRVVTANTAFNYQIPANTFIDIDAGDRLTLVATLSDGTSLPAWLAFDEVTSTFSGVATKDSGVLDVRVNARDLLGASVSDIFTFTVAGAGKGNEGVGNGQDAPPPGHDYNQNDGPGTAPGNPGRKGGGPGRGVSVKAVAAANVITGGNGKDKLIGTEGADFINGGGQDDVLSGGPGDDSLSGDAGNDTYLFGRGSGWDLVSNYDARSTDDKVLFGAAIATDQLWFRKNNDDLRVGIIGTYDQVTLQNWYLGNDYRIDKFQTTDGSILLERQVENLVNAMAAFAPPSAGQLTLPPEMQTALQPVIAAGWQSA